MTELERFYKGKRVFVTGHTGFKGSWLVKILNIFGAEVCGYALAQEAGSLFNLLGTDKLCNSIIGDVRDYNCLQKAISAFKPEIVLHLAAQPLVLESYKNPRDTYEVNVMGTVNLLESIKTVGGVRSVVNITTDKVYKNNERDYCFCETDELCGFDPYSNSKSCSELVTYCYNNSFLKSAGVAVSTVRAGNVIGGGDFAADRIIPDCVRAAAKGEVISVRNPYSVRPYQHVLEPLFVYLKVAMNGFIDNSCASAYNVGPENKDCLTTGALVELFCKTWGGILWQSEAVANAPHEACFLKLDSSKIREKFGIKPIWDIQQTMRAVVDWYKIYCDDGNVSDITERQIKQYLAEGRA